MHDLPGVGENLQDHLEMYMQYECKEPVSLYPALQWWNQPAIGLEWMLNGTGIGASNQFEAGGFIRTRDDDLWPNIQYHFLPVAINYNGSNPIRMHGFQAHVGSMRSPSRGHVKLKSRDPNAHPAILFNYMADPLDWREFRDAIRITREIMRQPALGSLSRSRASSFRRSDKAMRNSMRSCARRRRRPFILRVRARWVMTIWLSSMGKDACMGWKDCASSMRRSCRRSRPAISMRRRSCWRRRSRIGFGVWRRWRGWIRRISWRRGNARGRNRWRASRREFGEVKG